MRRRSLTFPVLCMAVCLAPVARGQGSDACGEAPAVYEDSPVSGTNAGATGTDITSCTYADAADLWFVYTPPRDGHATVSLCGSGFDTSLAVFDACEGTELACSDDTTACGVASELDLSVTGGLSYFIRIAGYMDEVGDYTLTVTRKPVISGDCSDNLLLDGGFETGTPNSLWQEGSTNFGTPLCTQAVCNAEIGQPFQGAWWAWFGGIASSDEDGYVSQQVTIPDTDYAILWFYLSIPTALAQGYMRASIDGTELFSVTEADQAQYASYTPVVLDVSAYADGATHTILFEGGSTAGDSVFNAFLDEVCLTALGSEGEGEGEGEASIHSADQNENTLIELTELLRVIQFYSSDGLSCATNPDETEDGYVPGAGGDTSCGRHASDYAPADWRITLVELMRLIQFYNMGGYHYCSGEGTEDGFCPGPA